MVCGSVGLGSVSTASGPVGLVGALPQVCGLPTPLKTQVAVGSQHDVMNPHVEPRAAQGTQNWPLHFWSAAPQQSPATHAALDATHLRTDRQAESGASPQAASQQ